jgi:hypothetical protein
MIITHDSESVLGRMIFGELWSLIFLAAVKATTQPVLPFDSVYLDFLKPRRNKLLAVLDEVQQFTGLSDDIMEIARADLPPKLENDTQPTPDNKSVYDVRGFAAEFGLSCDKRSSEYSLADWSGIHLAASHGIQNRLVDFLYDLLIARYSFGESRDLAAVREGCERIFRALRVALLDASNYPDDARMLAESAALLPSRRPDPTSEKPSGEVVDWIGEVISKWTQPSRI